MIWRHAKEDVGVAQAPRPLRVGERVLCTVEGQAVMEGRALIGKHGDSVIVGGHKEALEVEVEVVAPKWVGHGNGYRLQADYDRDQAAGHKTRGDERWWPEFEST